MKYLKLKFANKILANICLALGSSLLLINLFGLTQDVHPANIDIGELRFNDDVELTYKQSLDLLEWKKDDNSSLYTERATKVISKTLAHIQWNDFDIRKYNQLVPIWENYFLYLMGVFSGIPEYERYHFTDYRRSLSRGIGICGDAAMVMSEVLNKNSIHNQIITFPGHVIVAAHIDGKEQVYDPDFGVLLPYSIEQINISPTLVSEHYKKEGYSDKEINNLVNKYGQQYQVWNGVKHFVTNKYYFEKFAYFMKWPLPILMIIFFLVIYYKNANNVIEKSII